MLSRSQFLHTLAAPLIGRAARPNMVVILVDDLRWDDIGCAGHPFVRTPNIDGIARSGARFRNAFVTTPLCSPSRASFLTGRYAHAHGIIDNTDRSAHSRELATFPRQLHQAGYETAFIGKWHMGVDDRARPGFTHWVSFKGQGECIDPELNIDGTELKESGYITDILTDRAIAFLKQRRGGPFLLYLAHKAIHPNILQRADGSTVAPTGGAEDFIPADRHRRLYAGEKIGRRPNAHAAPRDKPALARNIGDLPPLGPPTGTDDEVIRNRLRMLAAVDEGTGRILQTLEELRQLDDTVIVLAGDNGYFYGEHGLSTQRRLAYEESIRIPLLLRYPRLARPGSVLDQFALNIDLAPTLLELAGERPHSRMHGRSLVPLFRGTAKSWRRSFLVEYFSDLVSPRILNMGYQAVRTERWKYIHYTELLDMDEMYDLQGDPYEMRNLLPGAAGRGQLRDLKGELARLLRETA